MTGYGMRFPEGTLKIARQFTGGTAEQQEPRPGRDA
jgi:hypothetical protein